MAEGAPCSELPHYAGLLQPYQAYVEPALHAERLIAWKHHGQELTTAGDPPDGSFGESAIGSSAYKNSSVIVRLTRRMSARPLDPRSGNKRALTGQDGAVVEEWVRHDSPSMLTGFGPRLRRSLKGSLIEPECSGSHLRTAPFSLARACSYSDTDMPERTRRMARTIQTPESRPKWPMAYRIGTNGQDVECREKQNLYQTK